MSEGGQAIRPASTVVLWRNQSGGPEVLMGQRGAGAVFMPSKYVFPGGAVEPDDFGLASLVSPTCLDRLSQMRFADCPSPEALIGTALRELCEETGLTLNSAADMRFIFRAITPPGRSRRFDARFFLASASAISNDPDEFGAASDELRHLHWIGLAKARALDLPFITEVVIAEVAALLTGIVQPGVPFFDNSGPVPVFRRIV